MSDAFDYFIAVNSQGATECVVKVNGIIDLGNAAVLQGALFDGLIGAPTRLIVNLAAVSSIDSSGLDVLVGAQRRSSTFGTELLFQHPSDEVAHLLEQNGLCTAAVSAIDSTGPVPAERPRFAPPPG